MLILNKGFAEWGEVLGNQVIATAILDRLLHYDHVISIRGNSCKLKDKKRAGLLPMVHPEQEVKAGTEQI